MDITAFDWQRMIFGDAPPAFLLEILFRTLVIWLWTAALLRWIGGRSISQLSIVEFLLVIALGSATGDAMFYPEVPLVHAMLVILMVCLLDKLLHWAILRWRRAKDIIDGRPVEVMRDGRIISAGSQVNAMGTLELMEMLRLQGIANLGNVRAAYLEPSGKLSVFRFPESHPGLRIVPPVDLTEADHPPPGAEACCRNCGYLAERAEGPCACGTDDWTRPEIDDMGS